MFEKVQPCMCGQKLTSKPLLYAIFVQLFALRHRVALIMTWALFLVVKSGEGGGEHLKELKECPSPSKADLGDYMYHLEQEQMCLVIQSYQISLTRGFMTVHI